MKRTTAWLLALAVIIITLTSCTPTKNGGTAKTEASTVVPATNSGKSLPEATPHASATVPAASSDPSAKGGKNALTAKDSSTITAISQIISDAQQYLKDETLPDINTD